MGTWTEGWECEHCGGHGHITWDTRPSEGVPPVYGGCDVCGYNFGRADYGEGGFAYGDSYEYLKGLHDINYDRAEHNKWKDETEDDKPFYTEEEYRKIIDEAGLGYLITGGYHGKRKWGPVDFSDEHCRIARPNRIKSWCLYCQSKGLMFSAFPMINWLSNPFEVKQ